MNIRVRFSPPISKLISDGYKKKHKKPLDDTVSIEYYYIPEYIKLGKQVRRRERLDSFLNNWGKILFWVIIIGGLIVWTTYSNHQRQVKSNKRSETNYQRYSNDSNSSKSGIYDAEYCPITTCNDGSCSSSTGRGACSHHGGVAY